MPDINEAKAFLASIGMPKAQQADICALSILAIAGLKPSDTWESATNEWQDP